MEKCSSTAQMETDINVSLNARNYPIRSFSIHLTVSIPVRITRLRWDRLWRNDKETKICKGKPIIKIRYRPIEIIAQQWILDKKRRKC